MDGKSKDISLDIIEKLKAIIPGAFAEEKINIEQLKQILGDSVNNDAERYQLSWAGKNDAYKILQTSTTSTLNPKPSESINWEHASNIFIEGENLEVLKVLQKSYYGKIKVICIDPPYNTGSDSFIYPDKFSESKEEYFIRIGDKDDEGYLMKEGLFRPNRKENGQFHSNWLSMMLPRLFLARNLLKDDGLIFVHIDDNEITNLRLLMNEVFGEENYIQEIVWQRHAGGGNDSKYFAIDHEYILCYAKNISSIDKLRMPLSTNDIHQYKQKDRYFDTLGPYKTKSFLRMRPDDPRPGLQYSITCPDGSKIFNEWKWEEISFLKALEEDKVIIRKDDKDKWIVEYKLYLNSADGKKKEKVPRSLFQNEARNSQGKQTLTKVMGKANVFNNPKPIELLKTLINLGSSHDTSDIILDFFAGSGSTGQAVLELNNETNGNRKFILVQMPEKTQDSSEAFKAGYRYISEITIKRLSNVLTQINKQRKSQFEFKKTMDQGFRFFSLANSNFKIWRGRHIASIEDLKTQVEIFKKSHPDNINELQILWELMIKSGICLDIDINETNVDGKSVYFIEKPNVAFCFTDITDSIVKELIAFKPSQFICLDSAFNNEDCAKTNIILKLQENDIEFKSI
ncbi:MAG: site-specific DNA-methyltransferase [Candidatus Marinimicrobia bacterium]|nr:site-specific DNA-methyltransferase [Candidatus Neomarinimicrobiota bacterium]